ncbi:hypothetical protein MMC07_002843 [Pseudocyphellaria aurata]|nr:hypothetical protein [Pseudocyphellaria aurata]
MPSPFSSPVKMEPQSPTYGGFQYLNQTTGFDHSAISESAGAFLSSGACVSAPENTLDHGSLSFHRDGLMGSSGCAPPFESLGQGDESREDDVRSTLVSDRPYDLTRNKQLLRVSYDIAHASMHKPHRCDLCGTGFDRQEHLTRHNKTKMHLDTLEKNGLPAVKPPQAHCPFCGKGFTRSDNLTPHIKTHFHNGERITKSGPVSVEESTRRGLGRIDPRLNQSLPGRITKPRAKRRRR